MAHKANVNPIGYIITRWWVLFGLVVLPLVYAPWMQVAFEVPRVWAFLVWVDGLVVMMVFNQVVYQRPFKLAWEKVLWWGLLGAWLVVSAFLGVDTRQSWWGNFYRQDGLVVWWHWLALVMVVAQMGLGQKKKMLIALGVGSVLAGMLIVLQPWLGESMGLLPSGWSGGNGGSFGNPAYAAGFLVMLLPVVMGLATRDKKLWWVGVGLVLMAIVMTGNSVGIGLAIGVLIWWKMLTMASKRKGWMLGLAVLVVIVILGVGWELARADDRPDSRERLIRHFSEAVAERPITGWGWANVTQAFEASDWPIRYDHDIYVDKAHSSLVELVVTTGLVGLGMYLVAMGLVGRYWWEQAVGKRGSWWGQAGLMSLVVGLVFAQTNVTGIAGEMVLAVWVGMSLGRGE